MGLAKPGSSFFLHQSRGLNAATQFDKNPKDHGQMLSRGR